MLAKDLERLQLFGRLTAEQLATLAPLFRRVRFAADSHVFTQGEHAHELFVLESGTVVIRFRPDDGGSLLIATLQPGDVFGWSAALGRSQYTSSAICSTSVEALAIHGRHLQQLVHADPQLGRVLLEVMAQVVASRLEGFRDQLVRLLSAAAQDDQHAA